MVEPDHPPRGDFDTSIVKRPDDLVDGDSSGIVLEDRVDDLCLFRHDLAPLATILSSYRAIAVNLAAARLAGLGTLRHRVVHPLAKCPSEILIDRAFDLTHQLERGVAAVHAIGHADLKEGQRHKGNGAILHETD